MTDHLPSKERDILAELRALPGAYRLLGYTAAEEIQRLRTTLTGIASCASCEMCRGAAKRALGGDSTKGDG